jgi:hypothetical protein
MNPTQREHVQWAALTMLGLIAGLALALPLGVPHEENKIRARG